MNALTIDEIAIRQDAGGRYCLNDLHRAAGDGAKHKPGNWLMLDQTKALITEIEIAGNPAIFTKQGLGTFVVKELVYAYAMWISAAFHLKVIRKFDAAVTGQQAQPANLSRMEILNLAMDSERARLAAEAKLALAAPKVIFFDKVVERTSLMTASQIGQKLGMSAIKLNKRLDELGIYSLNVKRARVFKQWVIDKGYGELKQTELGFSQPLFTTAGEAWIVERLTSEGVA